MNGGLIVDGLCKVDKVTINGGVLIKGTGRLCLSGSLVNGGLTVQPNGDLDSNFGESPCVAGGPNNIHGGVTFDHPSNIDMFGDTIDGTVKVDGVQPSFAGVLLFCDLTVRGDLMIRSISKSFEIGDPGDDFPCAGNTITGSVHILDSVGGRIEFEGNTIGGSLIVSNSTISASGNTIGGSLLCQKGGKRVVFDADDTNPNTVRGATHC